ncbi:MoaD/ThiS family protein [Jhaorihella thermophila]|uniref:Molybdopterin synthase sulfur carrier subunit n=1 Tax=Jhaorihella thermophila TaxID=488547 RepID=A0A1H5U643_9RHOB|nr:MoaD/ThiS family protein [Jhaorihella thermophila]SEF70479.1 molybdopterin synthase sulfur carrier subunit [Jhaorihella thermophila]
MPEVHLWSGLRALAGGREVVEVEGRTVGELLDALVAAYPALKEPIEAGVSVAVDGRVIASALNEPVRPDSEIYLMQRLRGG